MVWMVSVWRTGKCGRRKRVFREQRTRDQEKRSREGLIGWATPSTLPGVD